MPTNNPKLNRIKVFYTTDCSISVGLISLLDQLHIDYKPVDFVLQPLTEYELQKIFQLFKDNPLQLIRSVKDPASSKHGITNIFALVRNNPSLLQRPIIIKGKKAIVCRPMEKIFEILLA